MPYTTNNSLSTVDYLGFATRRCYFPRLLADNTWKHTGTPDVADLAASYAVGIARNHPFIDGNKRTALVVALGLFSPSMDMRLA